MKIPCQDIALHLKGVLSHEVELLRAKNIHPKLVTVLIGSAPEQLSFVRIKRRVAQEIGVDFELVHLEEEPSFEQCEEIVASKAQDSATTAMIIQQPLPASFSSEILYRHIPPHKEIEGHRADSSFHFPLSLAVAAGLKYVALAEAGHDNPVDQSFVSFDQDKELLATFLENKRVVVVGRGITGGKPIAKLLQEVGCEPIIVHTKTQDALDQYIKADIIITATGKHILSPVMIKKGAILLNVGLRKENGFLKGDYDEQEMDSTASYYTQTPSGLGPLDVLYLFQNTIQAARS